MGQIPSELQNFASFLATEVNGVLNESANGGFREEAFTGLVMDYLTDANETGNVQVCTAVHRNRAAQRVRQMNGYALWDDFESLDLFIAEYRGDGQIYTLEKSRIQSSFNLLARYLDFAWKGSGDGIEESASEKEFLANFGFYRDRILRVRLILLTDGMIKDKEDLPNPRSVIDDVTIISEVWDLDRICQNWSSGRKREPVVVDLPGQYVQHISVLPIENDLEGYRAYLAIVPGLLLVQLYDDFGSRLLEKNVRVYLQNKGKVNREIRKTIHESPGMFMAYNNGISATATEISFAKGKDGLNIISTIRGLQIVNGGQTTSSIYYAWKRDRFPIDEIYLQMKLTIIHDEGKAEMMIGRISKYANSQNKVTEIDLTSNQSFHIQLEELSRTTWTPSIAGSSTHTRWYYERTKGQYQEDVNKERTPLRRKNFKEKNPVSQVIRKEEFAKYRNTWKMLPHWVARASQKNYLQFIKDEGGLTPDRTYFRQTAAIAILFKAAERLYGIKPAAMGDLRYIVVPYSLAWLNHYTQGRLDLDLVWQAQAVSGKLLAVLESTLRKVNAWFQDCTPQIYSLVSEWAKKEDCWNTIKGITPKEWGINLQSIAGSLTAREAGQQDRSGETETALRNISRQEWESIELNGKTTGRLDLIQLGVVRNIIRRLEKGRPLGTQLTEQGQKLLEMYRGQTG